MSLATTCPTCKTSFRVVPDQLKLRRGLVRCGACHCVFSGVDALRHLPDPAHAARHLRDDERDDALEIAAALADTPPAADDVPELESVAEALPDAPMAPDSEPEADELPDAPDPEPSAGDVLRESAVSVDPWSPLRSFPEPAAVETPATDPDVAPDADSDIAPDADSDIPPDPDPDLTPASDFAISPESDFDIAPEPELDSATGDGSETVAEAGAEPPTQEIEEEDEEDAIDFFATGSGRRVGWRPRSAVARSIALLLGIVLAAQLALGGRDWLAAYFPQTRPWLDAFARPFGLQVDLLRRPDAVTIESFELTSGSPPGSYRLSALLRSRADTALQWPAIELSLTDASGAIVVRRVLMARDYIANPSVVSQGLPARSEYPVLIGLEFGDLTPTGYSALLFYP